MHGLAIVLTVAFCGYGCVGAIRAGNVIGFFDSLVGLLQHLSIISAGPADRDSPD
jgi:hypothetical protein